jgi:hypothetical protein
MKRSGVSLGLEGVARAEAPRYSPRVRTTRPLLFSALALLLVGAVACSNSGSAGGEPTPSGDAGDASHVVTPPGTPDGGLDAADASGPSALPSCLGASLPLAITTGPHLSVTVGAAPAAQAGPFLVDYATTGSTIELTAFAAPAPPATGCTPSLLGQRCTFADLDFFGAWGAVTLVTSTASILGTDFLAHGIYTLDYAKKQMRHAAAQGACSDAALSAAGLVALSTAGFFASDLALLRPQQDLDSAAAAGLQVANVPVVPVRIAGTPALAQLDTGFDDGVVVHSINVNVAFFDAINLGAPGALVRDAARDLTLSTCAGVAEAAEAYQLAPGNSFDLINEAGAIARVWTSATVFVKRTPVAAKHCGGIGSFTVAAAQIGTSFFNDLRALVFDPYASRVWVGR